MLDGESHEVARKYANDHAQQCTAHPLRTELVTLRTSLAEQALVIEQQGLDMERVRKIAADLRAYLDDKYTDVNRRWVMNALAAILNKETSMSEFTVPNISIAGAPTIDWKFTGAVGRAEIDGAKAYSEAIDAERADLRVTDATGEVLADVVVRRMSKDESITVSVMNVGTALLWSHVRWLEANEEGAPCTTK